MIRHHGLPRHDRFRRLCKNEFENEIYFMLQCPVYKTLWQKYLPRKYYIFPIINEYNILMLSHSETVINNVATYMYLYYALNYDKSYLKAHASIYIDVMLGGIPYLCTCNFTVYMSLFHVLWTGDLNHNKPFLLVLDNRRSRA